MKLFIVSVYDRAADVFNRPFFVPHLNVAIRDFTDEVKRVSDDNPLNKHPDDFDLYLMGEFDDNQGQFDCQTSPTVLARAKDVIQTVAAV